MFQDQTLEEATTWYAVFKVIDGFGSFVNYDLVEHLIGSSEDKAQLKENKGKFNEYAYMSVLQRWHWITSTDGQKWCVCVKLLFLLW